MKTAGIAPEGGEASLVGFLMKSFKCKYKAIACNFAPTHFLCPVNVKCIVTFLYVIGPAIQLCTYCFVQFLLSQLKE